MALVTGLGSMGLEYDVLKNPKIFDQLLDLDAVSVTKQVCAPRISLLFWNFQRHYQASLRLCKFHVVGLRAHKESFLV